MSQNLQNVAKFQNFQLENLVDFEKCCKTHIFLQKAVPIQPKTNNICRNFAKNWQLPYGSGPDRRTLRASRATTRRGRSQRRIRPAQQRRVRAETYMPLKIIKYISETRTADGHSGRAVIRYIFLKIVLCFARSFSIEK